MQYLVKVMCDFSWQVYHCMKFWEIAGPRNVVFFHTKSFSKMGWRFCSRNMFGCVRNMAESDLYWRHQFYDFSPVFFKSEFRVRRNIWWNWRMISAAPRIVNDAYIWRGSIMRVIFHVKRNLWWNWKMIFVAPYILNDIAYVSRIYHESHFSWQT